MRDKWDDPQGKTLPKTNQQGARDWPLRLRMVEKITGVIGYECATVWAAPIAPAQSWYSQRTHAHCKALK